MRVPTIEKVEYLRLKHPDMRAVDIARKLNVSRERVRQLLNKLGMETNVQVSMNEQKIKALLKVRPLLTLDEIGQKAGVQRKTVEKYANKFGVTVHSRFEEKAFKASGHYNWRRCYECNRWDSPKNLFTYGNSQYFHRDCFNKRARDYRKRKSLAKGLRT